MSMNVYSVLHTILEAIEPGNRISFFFSRRCGTEYTNLVSDETVEKLGVLFSDQLLLAALDLIDRDCGKCLPSSSKERKLKLIVSN